MTPKGLVVLGFGGHARSIADVALRCGIENLLFVDVNAAPGENFFGFPVQVAMPERIPEGWCVFPAAGDNALRRQQCDTIAGKGWPTIALISKNAYIGYNAKVGEATFVAPQAHLGPMTSIGRGCIINSLAVVNHECIVRDWTHIAVNANVAGRTHIGNNVFVGAGATIIERRTIVDDVIVGAGSVVIRDITIAGVYVGVPVKRIGKAE